jgi:hypothetical protein
MTLLCLLAVRRLRGRRTIITKGSGNVVLPATSLSSASAHISRRSTTLDLVDVAARTTCPANGSGPSRSHGEGHRALIGNGDAGPRSVGAA